MGGGGLREWHDVIVFKEHWLGFTNWLKRTSEAAGEPRGRFLAEIQASNHGGSARLEDRG